MDLYHNGETTEQLGNQIKYMVLTGKRVILRSNVESLKYP